MDDDDLRPDPDALLRFANKAIDTKGKLKIFLGAAPGVGKTYAMLAAAQKLLSEKRDVVVGLVETHRRKETEKLLEGLPILPLAQIEYKGKKFPELNVPLILERRPEYIIVDELAHSNIPGSEHNKRYLDVLDLLDAGINVYTTLNIQHIESLNDDIEQVTGVKVREVVPDSIIENADEVVVIDLTPKELLQRLQEGKVYVPDMAKRAIQHFFSLNNIAALRELTFRAAAKRAGQELTNYKQVHGIEEPWHVNERVLVCISASPVTPRLIRMAGRIAKRDDAKLIALYIESPGDSTRTKKNASNLNHYKHYAQTQGAEIVTLNAVNKAQAILDYAKSHNVTHIVMGKSTRPGWMDKLFGSIVYEVIRKSQGISVHVVNEMSMVREKEDLHDNSVSERVKLKPFLYGFLSVAGVGWLIHFLNARFSLASTTMLFLLVIIFVAFRYGLYPSLFAAVFSFLVYLYLYLPPHFTFHVETISQGLTFIVFLIVSIIISQLAGRARGLIESSNRREYMTGALFSFSQSLAAINELKPLIDMIIKAMSNTLELPVAIILLNKDKIKLDQCYPKELEFEQKDLAGATWCWEHKKPCGKGTETLAGLDWYYYPLHAGEDYVGVLAIKVKSVEAFFNTENQYLFLSMTSQAAVAMIKMNLELDREAERVSFERNRLQQSLLTSVSQDFRKPLGFILETLKKQAAASEKGNHDRQLQSANIEAERLNRYVDNLLSLTQLESGALVIHPKLTNIPELFETILREMKYLVQQHTIKINPEENLPFLKIDPHLTKQVFVNLIENAVKFSPKLTTIQIDLYVSGRHFYVDVIDQGKGLKPGDQERVFDLFYREQTEDAENVGFGMGLTICRGILQVQQATIEASSEGLGKGSLFRVKFRLT